MKIRGKVKSIAKDWTSGQWNITIEMIEGNINEIDKYHNQDVSVDIKQFRKHRSLDANAMLWACLGEISEVLHCDKWDLYIKYLSEYGQYTMVSMKAEALPQFEKVYRECEVVGSRYIDGEEILQVLCYYGSSTYDSREFGILLDAVINDMKQAGLETPTSQEMKRALEMWENEQDNKKRVHK